MSAAVSALVHGVAIAASVVATATPDIARREIPEVSIARFLAPPNRPGRSMEQREQLKFVALAEERSAVPDSRPRPVEPPVVEDRPSGFDLVDAPAKPEITGSDSVFMEIEVDSAATRYAWSAAPVYPAAMLAAKREGYVKAQWVVDENGVADTTSFVLIEFTSQEFALAVRDALPQMRFSPAKIGAKHVRQLVEQQFAFRINSVLVPEPRKPPGR